MKCYDMSRRLYQETVVSGFGHGAGLPQVGEGMYCWHDEVLDIVTVPNCVCIQKLVVFRVATQKHLIGSYCHTKWSQKILPLLVAS